jgi:S-formylglutathione hydrolase
MKKMITLSILFSLLFIFIQYGNSQTTQPSDFEPTVFEGSTEVDSIYSPALEGNLLGVPSNQPVKVYLPPSYENFPNNRYPVVFILHNHTNNYNVFFENHNIVEKLDRLISQKTISPMIIATPNAETKYGGSCYTNTYVSGNWEDYIINDVFQYIENSYFVLDQPESRGLAGFCSAGYGTMNIAMKHPSKLGSIGTIGAVHLDLNWYLNGFEKDWIIEAAGINEYRPEDPWYIPAMYAWAEAFAPDSTALPILGRLPYTADSVIIDSAWQEWMEHDLLTMLEIYKDSLLKLNTIQMYVGNKDNLTLQANDTFHQALLDNGIDHGYETYIGEHNPEPVIEALLIYFSESLVSVVPTVRSLSEYSLLVGDTLVLKSDMNGILYIVPDTVYPAIDSIIKYPLTAVDVTADEEIDFNLSEFEPGNYLVYAVSNENMVSNIPAEFSIIPGTTSISFPKKDQSSTTSVEVFPIPARENITLLIDTQYPYEITITALNGQQTQLESFRKSKCQIDLSSFEKGVYFITIRSKDFVTTKKIIKL